MNMKALLVTAVVAAFVVYASNHIAFVKNIIG